MGVIQVVYNRLEWEFEVGLELKEGGCMGLAAPDL